jgi:hypothetical protein
MNSGIPGKEPRRLWDDRFFSRDHTQEASLQDGRLEIDLGLDGCCRSGWLMGSRSDWMMAIA